MAAEHDAALSNTTVDFSPVTESVRQACKKFLEVTDALAQQAAVEAGERCQPLSAQVAITRSGGSADDHLEFLKTLRTPGVVRRVFCPDSTNALMELLHAIAIIGLKDEHVKTAY